jgi:UDP:flavonoid glycosyltransferase YjiC (YdhE family)
MKVLFTPMAASSLAHMTRLFAIADEMKKRGHKVLFTSSSDRVSFINGHGYDVYHHTYSPINFNDPKDQSLNYIKDNRKSFEEWFKIEIEAAQEFKPNVVITSPGFLGPHVTYKTGIPTVAILNAPYLAESVGILGLSLTKSNVKNIFLRSLLKPLFEKKFTNQYLHEVLEIYKVLEIDFFGDNRKALYEKMDIIIPSIYELEPIKPKSSKYYSGPLFWKGFEKKYSVEEQEIKNLKKRRKLIYLSFGGSIFNKDFYNVILGIIGKLPYAFVVSTGPNVSIKELYYNKDNTLVYQFVPGLKMCEMADLLVNTGSHGTIMQALKFGKPIICMPCNIDQSYFAYRIEELGIGININKTSLTKFSERESYYKLNSKLPDELKEAIEKILTNPKYTNNAITLSKQIKQHGNAAKNICYYVESKYGN